MNNLKLIGYLIIAAMVVNLILFTFRLITIWTFWVIIIIGAIFAWKIVPRLNKKNQTP